MFSLPKLDYQYDALEKCISKEIMELHHSKHHQTYVDKLNAALENHYDLQAISIEELVSGVAKLPKELQKPVRNFGGGHYNHSLFWKFMSPNGGGQPGGQLADDINAKYGNFQKFVDEFSAQAIGVFGSGWAWLLDDLSIVTTTNQDSPIMDGKKPPILSIDVWEHAYYLDYTYKRPDYVKAFWEVVNWAEVAKSYKK